MEFARADLEKAKCFWSSVLWSDGTEIELLAWNQVQRVRRKREVESPGKAVPSVNHGVAMLSSEGILVEMKRAVRFV